MPAPLEVPHTLPSASRLRPLPFYKQSAPVSPFFATLTESAHLSDSTPLSRPLFSYSYALFGTNENAMSFSFNRLRTLCAKHGGCGCSVVSAARSFRPLGTLMVRTWFSIQRGNGLEVWRMKLVGNQIRVSATDLSNHLACRHLTSLDLKVARGERKAPDWAAPDLVVIQQLGLRHEAEYLKFLRDVRKLSVFELPKEGDPKALAEETQSLMAQGADAIAQGALGDNAWYGRPDVLLRVAKASGKWKWSYEVQDTKLARETKGTTILQIALYSELVGKLQGSEPELMWVIPPGNDFAGEAYRFAEYAAYYRYVKQKFLDAVAKRQGVETYPEPVEHCQVCRWFKECDAQRRADDHLSLVAGIMRQQRSQLDDWDAETMAKLAKMPIPLKERPERGSRDGYAR